jgi:hypothetical protein
MNAFLLTAALAAAQTPPATGRDAGRPADAGQSTAGQAAAGRDAGRMTTQDTAAVAALDGTWTVLALEMNGRPMADARDARVTIRNGTLLFDGRSITPMRVEFGPMNTVRVTDALAAGTGENTRRPGDPAGGRPGDTGATGGAPASGPPARAGDAGRIGTAPTGGAARAADVGTPTPGSATAQARSGVYVLTQDLFVLAVHDDAGRLPAGVGTPGSTGGTGTGDRGRGPAGTPSGDRVSDPGVVGTRDRTGAGPVGEPGTTPGVVGNRTPPERTNTDRSPAGTGAGSGGTAAAPGTTGGMTATGMAGPTTRSYATIVLRRSGALVPAGGTDRR